MTKNHWFCLIGGILAGVVLAPKIRSLPVLSKLPSA